MAGQQPVVAKAARRIRLAAFVLAIAAFVSGGVLFLTSTGGHDGAYGSIRIPGTKVLHLPAGRVDMTFTMDLENQTVDIPVLGLGVQPVNGGSLLPLTHDIESPVGINGVTHVVVAWVEVPTAGNYRIGVQGNNTFDPNPQLLLGPQSWSARIGSITLVTVAGLLLIGFVAGYAIRRAKRRAELHPTVTDAITSQL
jgi:hypothetical protein